MTKSTLAPEEGRKTLEKIKNNRQFNIIKDLHKDIKYLNPDENKVDSLVRDSFLDESIFTESRQEIKLMLTSLKDLLIESKSLEEFAEKGLSKVEQYNLILEENEQVIKNKTSELEKSLRQLDLFYKNTGQKKLEDLTIMVYGQDLLKKDPDDKLYNTLYDEVKRRYDAVDQGDSVGYIVCPTFPGKSLLERFAELANKNRTMFLSGYRDLPNVEETFNFLDNDRIGGEQVKWSNLAVFANTIIAHDGMRLSPAAAVGGRMYNSKISQPVAGYLHGDIVDVAGLTYNVTTEEVNLFKDRGVIPLLTAWKQDMPYGMWTTYMGPDVDFQQYSIVRVRDWIARCLNDHLRKCCFNLTDKKVLRGINSQISHFLDKISRAGIIEQGEVTYFDKDNVTPDRIDIEIVVTYLYAIRLFTYKFLSSRKLEEERLEVEGKDS